MATIYDLIELSSLTAHTTYSFENNNLLGIVDGATSSALDDGEFDEGDSINIGGTAYTISLIQKPQSSARLTDGLGNDYSVDPGNEDNLDAVFLTVSNGSETRYFVVPNDSYGDINVMQVRTGDLNDALGNDVAVIGTTDNNVQVVCFARGTRVAAARGRQIAVEALKTGDRVQTADRGLREVKWIGSTVLDARTLRANPHLVPVRIARGALGCGLPETDLIVSPQHRVLVRSRIARRMFGAHEVLVAAKQLCGCPGIAVDHTIAQVEYFHILLDLHEILTANGAPCESLFLGVETLKTLDRADLREISACLGHTCAPEPARFMVDGRRGRQLAWRHQRNDVALFATEAECGSERQSA